VSGRRGSMVEIAKCNGVGKQYVSRLIRLALADDVAQGRQLYFEYLQFVPATDSLARVMVQWRPH
jgi:hypothetical protein